MSIDTAIDLIESIKKYMIGEDGQLRIEENDLANAVVDSAVGHLADEALRNADLAIAFDAFLLDIERSDPSPKDINDRQAQPCAS